MNASWIIIIGLISFITGYRYYSKYITYSIFKLNKSDKTPAHELNDGIDYVPTKRHVLFGHHFTSIAGAAPIIGPCIAAYWGWLPALAWVVFGTIFIGAVHDFGALVISLKEKGRSVADISSKVISQRIRLLFLIFVMMLSWLVLAVFAMAIAGLFVSTPSSVLPVNIEVIIAMIVGYFVYVRKKNIKFASILALVLLYFFIWIGTIYPIELGTDNPQNTWIILLFLYSAIASILPVWFLLQPRDYINSHQLIVGLALIIIGIIIAQPIIDAPIVRLEVDASAPPIFPFLFITIACGAISGFHGLVSSGTTSKQVNNFQDARLIGYGSMLGEGTLALISTLCAVSGISLVSNCTLPVNGLVENLNWAVYYDSWAHASGNKATAFVLGGGAFLMQLGIPANIAQTLIAVLVISFAATTLDSATRIQRFIITEIGLATKIEILKNKYIAVFIAIIPAYLLTSLNLNTSIGVSKKIAWVLWPIFGASNQMLAALILFILTIYFWNQNNRLPLPLFIPMIFIFMITSYSLFFNFFNFMVQNNFLLAFVTLFLIIIILLITLEGIYTIKNKILNKRNI